MLALPIVHKSTSTTARHDLVLVKRALTGETDAKSQLGQRLACIDRFLLARNARAGSPLTRDQVDDLAQDVRVEVWRRLDAFEGRAALDSWVYRFCHLGFMKRRSRGFEQDKRRRAAQAHYANDRESTRRDEDDAPVSPSLANILQHLTDREALVTRRRHVEQLEFSEIASELGVSVSTAKTHYYRAVDKLRSVLSGQIEVSE